MKTYQKYLMVFAAVGGLMIGQTARATWTTTQFTDDASSGLSTSKTYTHLVDPFDSAGLATVNGVAFTDYAFSGPNYLFDFNGAILDLGAGGVAAGPGIKDVLRDLYYSTTAPGASVDETLTLSGLTIGTTYEARFYANGSAAIAGLGDRATDITLDNGTADQTILGYDGAMFQGTVGNPDGWHYLAVQYTAQGTSVVFDFVSPVGKQAYQQFGFSNEVVPQVPEPSAVLLLGFGLSLCYTARRCLKK